MITETSIIQEIRKLTAEAEQCRQEDLNFPSIIDRIKESAKKGFHNREFHVYEFGLHTIGLLEKEGFKVESVEKVIKPQFGSPMNYTADKDLKQIIRVVSW